ncbi:hypothetical protein SKAU_G00296120 [Synaphobranchus kaupii]|uniref:P-type domain-containing protein n=1 Tax=Synaphobranchus kaupii TaxID=118154 RepID=A0A9Q1IMK6_SYNKA|nr:hypothetical protein SKAU_G00296120 [Synaphobranchus kaupii]
MNHRRRLVEMWRVSARTPVAGLALSVLTIALFAYFLCVCTPDRKTTVTRILVLESELDLSGPSLERARGNVRRTVADRQRPPYQPEPKRKRSPVSRSAPRGELCQLPLEERFECARDRSLSRAECEARGCCYVPLRNSLSNGPPWCFYPPAYPGYKMGPLTPSPRGQTATLTRSTPSYLPQDISTLRLEVREESAGCLHLTLKDPAHPRYEVPLSLAQPRKIPEAQETLYAVEFQPDPFGFLVRRKSNGRVL